MAITGDPEGDPMKVGVALADVLAGKDAAIAILAALVRRLRTGQGARLTISLIDSARAALVNVAQNSLVTGRDADGGATRTRIWFPIRCFARLTGTSWSPWAATRSGSRARGRSASIDSPTIPRLRPTRAGFGSANASSRPSPSNSPRSRRRIGAARLRRAGVPSGVVRTVLETLRDTNASALTRRSAECPRSRAIPTSRSW